MTMSVDPATNAASGIIHLANTTREELPISLSASDFVSSMTRKGLNTRVVFSRRPKVPDSKSTKQRFHQHRPSR